MEHLVIKEHDFKGISVEKSQLPRDLNSGGMGCPVLKFQVME